MLPWFQNPCPLYLAPMAGVTDSVFRRLCKEQGADVMVTEFVSAEGIFRRNARTLEYLRFTPAERPLGVQLFGADPAHLAEAARQVRDWVAPDFLDLNFGCPVNKVVARNGGSALLRDLPLLGRIAGAVARAAAPLPVTAKIRLGWSRESVNAPETARILEGEGVQAIAVHGRTRDMAYGGVADWAAIDAVARAVRIPVIGNGDIRTPQDALRRRRETAVRGLMVGRGAMAAPWLFAQIKAAMAAEAAGAPAAENSGERGGETGTEAPRSGLLPPPADRQNAPAAPSLEARWAFIRRHCAMAVEARGAERPALHSLRARLMAYSHGMPRAKALRGQFAKVESLAGLDEVIAESLRLAAETAAESGLNRPDPLP